MMRLDECLVGMHVVYHAPYQDPSSAPGETGVITSVNSLYAFVRYGDNQHSKATAPQNLSPAFTEDNALYTKAALCRFWFEHDGFGIAKLECPEGSAQSESCVCQDELRIRLMAYQTELRTKSQSGSGAGGTGEQA